MKDLETFTSDAIASSPTPQAALWQPTESMSSTFLQARYLQEIRAAGSFSSYPVCPGGGS